MLGKGAERLGVGSWLHCHTVDSAKIATYHVLGTVLGFLECWALGCPGEDWEGDILWCWITSRAFGVPPLAVDFRSGEDTTVELLSSINVNFYTGELQQHR